MLAFGNTASDLGVDSELCEGWAGRKRLCCCRWKRGSSEISLTLLENHMFAACRQLRSRCRGVAKVGIGTRMLHAKHISVCSHTV